MKRIRVIGCILTAALLSTVACAKPGDTGSFLDSESSFRDQPTATSKVLFKTTKGTKFTVTAEREQWLEVQLPDGAKGWVMTTNVALDSSPQAPCLRYDLNGDGKPETITTKEYFHQQEVSEKQTVDGAAMDVVTKPEERRSHIIVQSEGKTLWEDTKNEVPLVSGEGGEDRLDMIADLDGNGSPEFVVSIGKSDVSPTHFQLFEWKNPGVKNVGTFIFRGDSENPKSFSWVEPKPDDDSGILDTTCWIEHFVQGETPGIEGAITFYRSQEFKEGKMVQDTKYLSGKARLRGGKPLLPVESWPSPMKEIKE